MADRVTVEEIARRLGVPRAAIDGLVASGALDADVEGRLDPGDIHRVRLLAGFETAGVPLEALIAADRAGRISLRYYDQLHEPPRPLSGRTYGEFAASVGSGASHLPSLFAAFGLAEPMADTALDTDTELLVAEMLEIVAATGQPDLAMRAIRLFGEGARRSADGVLGVYGDAVDRSPERLAGLPIDAVFESMLRPWARFARTSGSLARWLATRHLTRAIDEYSVIQTERILEADGFVAPRPTRPPAIAFVDLTAFTQFTQVHGDESAAAVALRLGEVAVDAVRGRGRLVKLLGDGVLLRFGDLRDAVAGALDILDALPDAGLPTGHAGVAAGYVIERDNDVFGRTVNLAARIADAAPDGRLYVELDDAAALSSDAYAITPVDAAGLQGIGTVSLADVRRAAPSAK
jgi:adenylate cyclase